MKKALFACVLLLCLGTSHAMAQATGSPPTGAFLTNVLGKFMTVFRSGAVAATGGAGILAMALLSIAVSKAGAKMGLREALSKNVWELSGAVIYTVIALNAPTMSAWFADSLANAVSTPLGAGAAPGGILSNPSALMSTAYKITEDIFKAADQSTAAAAPAAGAGAWDKIKAIPGMLENAAAYLPTMIVGLLILAGFAATAGIGMKAVISANAKIIIGTTMIPWLILPLTRPLGMFGVSLIVGAAAELAQKSVLVGIGFTVLQGFNVDANTSFQDLTQMAVAGCLVAWVCADSLAVVNIARGRF